MIDISPKINRNLGCGNLKITGRLAGAALGRGRKAQQERRLLLLRRSIPLAATRGAG
jgi:hypothetical protein